MQRLRFVGSLAAVFGAVAALTAVLGVFYNPVALGVAVPFAAAAVVFWYHASGRLEARMRRSAAANRRSRRSRNAAGAGPRWQGDPRGRTAGGAGGPAGARTNGARRERARARRRTERRRAFQTLGLEPGANQAEIRRAYREKAKTLHPDRGGDEASFKRVTEAYERLSD